MSENKKSENIDEKLEDKVEEMVEEKIEEKLKEEKKKSKNPLVIVVIVLVIALLATLGYIAYDKGLIFSNKKNNADVTDKDNNKDQKGENNVVQLDVNDSLVTKLFKRVSSGVGRCAVRDYYTDAKVSSLVLDDDLIYDIARANAEEIIGARSLTQDEFSKVVATIFGKNNTYTHNHREKDCSYYQYNDSTKMYEYTADIACGYTCTNFLIDEIIKAYKDDKTLTLEVGVLFSEMLDFDNIKWYKDFAKTEEVTDFTRSTTNEHFPARTIENAKKGTLYKMVFTLEDGNYVYSYTEPMNK